MIKSNPLSLLLEEPGEMLMPGVTSSVSKEPIARNVSL